MATQTVANTIKPGYVFTAVNGSIDMRSNLSSSARGPDANSSSSSADGQEIEEERRAIRELLSKMQLPKVNILRDVWSQMKF